MTHTVIILFQMLCLPQLEASKYTKEETGNVSDLLQYLSIKGKITTEFLTDFSLVGYNFQVNLNL